MQYPLTLSFKLLTLGQRIAATDASGGPVLYIKQKMFKIKEKVVVYADEGQSKELFTIAADRILDFSANYHFKDAEGNDWGSVRRRGMKSFFSATYEVMQDDKHDMTIKEESPMKKVVESLLGGIPVVGFLFNYLLNPSYIVRRPDGTELLRLTKKPAIFEGKFVLDKLSADLPADDEMRSLLALIMMVLLERKRG